MTTQMPLDGQIEAIIVLGLRTGKGHVVPFTSSAANTTPEFGPTISVVTVYATVDCFLQTGGSDVTVGTSNGHFLPSSTVYILQNTIDMVIQKAKKNDQLLLPLYIQKQKANIKNTVIIPCDKYLTIISLSTT